MKKVLFIVLLLTFNAIPQTSDFDSRVNEGIKQIYNIKFTEAEKTS